MRRLAAALLAALAVPAAAIPPALPPPDQFQFNVDGVWITCRLPQPGGPLTGCVMQDSLALLSITVHRRPDGTHRYDLHRNCLAPGPATQGFSHASRNGAIGTGETVRGGTMEKDLRTLLELRTAAECETIANWPHQAEQLLPRLERAFAVFRSLRYE